MAADNRLRPRRDAGRAMRYQEGVAQRPPILAAGKRPAIQISGWGLLGASVMELETSGQ